ncbi:hypothetical protein TNCV_252101 [Trichonephila clavipes]|nr:hypothetical protein TNCV_252101 [Trichonephila clavipes]
MSTKEREINPSKCKTKKFKSGGRKANRASFLTTFWIFFHCGQLTFRMADCEVDGATSYCKPPSLPSQVASKGNERAMTPTEEAAREET